MITASTTQRTLVRALVILLLSPALATAAIPSRSHPATTAFVDVTVIPAPGSGVRLPGHTVLIREGRIAAVAPSGELSPPAGAVVVEGPGRFLLPGLVDAHVHLEWFTDPVVLKLFLAHGVTTVRNMDGRPYLLDWREAVAAGELDGPRIVTAGPILDGDPPLRDDNTVVAGAEEATAAVEAQAEAGYDFVKVYTNLSREAWGAILRAADERGLDVAGHLPRGVALQEAIDSGQHALEHFDGLDEAIESDESPHADGWHWSKLYLAMPADPARIDAVAERIAASGLWIVPTLEQQERMAAPEVMRGWLEDPSMRWVPRPMLDFWAPEGRDPYTAELLASFGDEERATLERGRANRARLLLALHDAGARLAVGTDTPNPFVVPGLSLHQELANWVEAGVPAARALEAATRAPARLLGLERQIGTIEPGYSADLLLLGADPTGSIDRLERVEGVMARGRWYPAARLEAMLEEAAAIYRGDG